MHKGPYRHKEEGDAKLENLAVNFSFNQVNFASCLCGVIEDSMNYLFVKCHTHCSFAKEHFSSFSVSHYRPLWTRLRPELFNMQKNCKHDIE